MRFYNQPHRFYCGTRLHARSMVLCILDSAGTILLHKNFPTDPNAFRQAIAPYRDGTGTRSKFPPADLVDVLGAASRSYRNCRQTFGADETISLGYPAETCCKMKILFFRIPRCVLLTLPAIDGFDLISTRPAQLPPKVYDIDCVAEHRKHNDADEHGREPSWNGKIQVHDKQNNAKSHEKSNHDWKRANRLASIPAPFVDLFVIDHRRVPLRPNDQAHLRGPLERR